MNQSDTSSIYRNSKLSKEKLALPKAQEYGYMRATQNFIAKTSALDKQATTPTKSGRGDKDDKSFRSNHKSVDSSKSKSPPRNKSSS